MAKEGNIARSGERGAMLRIDSIRRACARVMVTAAAILSVTGSGQSMADEVFSLGPRDTPALITASVGSIGNVLADRDEAIAFTLEYRADRQLEFLFVRPSLGLMATTDRSIYGWFGLSTDIFFWRRLVLTPETGMGAYFKGDGQDLGSVLEFRSGGNLAWRFDSEARVGVRFHHLSNLGLGDTNLGTESLAIFYSHPL